MHGKEEEEQADFKKYSAMTAHTISVVKPFLSLFKDKYRGNTITECVRSNSPCKL